MFNLLVKFVRCEDRRLSQRQSDVLSVWSRRIKRVRRSKLNWARHELKSLAGGFLYTSFIHQENQKKIEKKSQMLFKISKLESYDLLIENETVYVLLYFSQQEESWKCDFKRSTKDLRGVISYTMKIGTWYSFYTNVTFGEIKTSLTFMFHFLNKGLRGIFPLVF